MNSFYNIPGEVLWREKYQIDFIENLPEEFIAVEVAPLLTLNIWRKSYLAKILIGHVKTPDNKVFAGDNLSNDWIKKSFLDDPDFSNVIDDIKNNEAAFARLFKNYRRTYRALLKSEFVINSDVEAESGTNYIPAKRFFKWCKQNQIYIDKEVKEGYKSLLKSTPASPTANFLSYKHLNTIDEVIAVTIAEFEEITKYPATHAEEILGRLKHQPPKDCKISFDIPKTMEFRGQRQTIQWLRTKINTKLKSQRQGSKEDNPE